MDRLLLVAFLTMLVHLLITFSYSIRLAGLRTRRLLTAVSIFNALFLLASAFNTMQAPLLTSVVEHAIKSAIIQTEAAVPGNQLVNQDVYREHLFSLAGRIRLVISASTLGTVLGAALTPFFADLLTRSIRLFEEVGSVPRVFLKMFLSFPRPRVQQFRLYFKSCFSFYAYFPGQRMNIPKTFLVTNIFATGLFTIGVLSALYAGALYPDFRSTATVLSGVVSGIAISVNAIAVEPTAALITDEAMRGDRKDADVKQMTFYLLMTRIIGTLFAQVVFLPFAHLIKCIALLFAR